MSDISKHPPRRTKLTWYLHIQSTHLYMLYTKIHLGDENIICQSKEANDTCGNYTRFKTVGTSGQGGYAGGFGYSCEILFLKLFFFLIYG